MRKLMSLRQCARYLGIPYQTLSNRRLRMPKDIPYTVAGSAKMVDPEVVRKRLIEMGYKIQQPGLERDIQFIGESALVDRAGSGGDAGDGGESQKKKKKKEGGDGDGEDDGDDDDDDDDDESPPSAPAQPGVSVMERGISRASSDHKKLNQFVLYRSAEEMLYDIDCGILQAGDDQCGQFKV